MYVFVIGRNYTSMLGIIRGAGVVERNIIAIRTVKKLKNKKMERNPFEAYSKYVKEQHYIEQDSDMADLLMVSDFLKTDYSSSSGDFILRKNLLVLA